MVVGEAAEYKGLLHMGFAMLSHTDLTHTKLRVEEKMMDQRRRRKPLVVSDHVVKHRKRHNRQERAFRNKGKLLHPEAVALYKTGNT